MKVWQPPATASTGTRRSGFRRAGAGPRAGCAARNHRANGSSQLVSSRRRASGSAELAHVEVEAGLRRPGAVLGPVVAGQGDEPHGASQGGPQAAGDLPAVQLGQADVQHGGVGTPGQRLLDALAAVPGRLHLKAPESQQQAEGLARVRLVLDHQDAAGRFSGA